MRFATRFVMASASVLALSAPAFGQDAADDSKDESKDIVVTGSQIRGIAPAGSNVIGVTAEDIEANGVKTTNELLSKIPQATNFFNQLPQPGGGVSGGNNVSVINRPNLRNLPGGNTSGTALTLVMFDGHRVVGSGIGMVAVDPDAIPPSAIERVEAITDGGSAVYGSDAIGGVVNFITRKRFDGVRIGAHYGFADNYKSFDANFIAGTVWETGSVYLAYGYSKHDPIFGINRDYVKNIDWNPASATFGLGQNRACDNANLNVGSNQYPGPNFTLATLPNTCDISDYQSLYMENEQHHGLTRVVQELNDWLSFDMTAYYTYRTDEGSNGPPRANNQSIANNQFYYRDLVGTPNAGATQTLNFSLGPVFGNYALRTFNKLSTWNVTPTFTANLGGKGNWQARMNFNYGESTTEFTNVELSNTALGAARVGTTAATAINPYNVAATNSAVLAGLLKNNYGVGKHRFADFRLVLDGSLLTLPGGDVRVAFGGEHTISKYIQAKTELVNYTLPAPVSYRQKVISGFAEVQVPVFGADNGFDGMRELSFSASGRYDKYDDFGDTFNPKFAVTWKPLDWVTVTGNYGKSFAAPSPADQLGPLTATSNISTGLVPVTGTTYASVPTTVTAPNTATYALLTQGQTAFGLALLRGTITGLKPQRTTNWSVGLKLQPPFLPGFRGNITYYSIDYRDAINSPQASADSQPFFREFPNLVIVDPTHQQVLDAFGQVSGGLANLNTNVIQGNANLINTPGGPRVVALFDIRARNLGLFRSRGIDFDASYTHETGFGSLDASFGGNLQFVRTNKASDLAVQNNLLLRDEPRMRFVSTLGATVGKFRAQASLYHTDGYDTTSAGAIQPKVGAFNVVNLFMKYDFAGEDLLKDLTVTLNIDNLFDKDPPILRAGGARQNGFTNGQTIGRFVQLGFSKKF